MRIVYPPTSPDTPNRHICTHLSWHCWWPWQAFIYWQIILLMLICFPLHFCLFVKCMLLHFDVERSWQTYRLTNGLKIMCSLLAVFVSTVWKMGENCLVKWLLFFSLSFATHITQLGFFKVMQYENIVPLHQAQRNFENSYV